MKSPIPDYLNKVLDRVRDDTSGANADYIEALAKADPDKMAVAVATVDGQVYSVGDDDVEFSMQSISKAFVYALAIEDRGLSGVLAKIGVEPSGDVFNKLSLESGTNKPMNPMINAGAITAHSLVGPADATAEVRVARILKGMSMLAGRELKVDEAVYEAEMKDWHRNMGLGFMLKAAGIIECDPAEAVKGYIRQCSINVTVRDLAIMAGTLGNGGVHPVTGERVIPSLSVRQVLSVMTTCGMYDAAGDWVSRVGIPAKSGVAGGIIGALPGQLGLAVFSPRLDKKGNSVRGMSMCEHLSNDMGMHMMDITQVGRATVHTKVMIIAGGVKQEGHENEIPIFELRGAIRFAGAERFTRALVQQLAAPSEARPTHGKHHNACAVIFSLKEAYSLNDVAQKLLREDCWRVMSEGRRLVVIDPNRVLSLKGKDELEQNPPKIVKSRQEARRYIGGAGCHKVSSHSDSGVDI